MCLNESCSKIHVGKYLSPSLTIDLLSGLVVKVPGYRFEFDSLRYLIF
jgi:hypothetical protein